MGRFVLNRAFFSIITLWILVTIIFLLVRVTGDPTRMIEQVGDEAYIERIRHDWGLDKGLHIQYVNYMGDLLTGDLGTSYANSVSVKTIYFKRLPASIKLGVSAFIISIALGVPMGMLTAIKVNTWWDNFGKVFALLGLSIPNFFVGIILIIIFGLELGWLPVLGNGDSFWDWKHLIMPSFALGWYFSGSMLRITRSSLLDVLGSDYIKLARLKGVPEPVVLAKHALKNAMIPVVTLGGLNLLIMVNVAIAIEVVFNWPGVGQLLYDGMTSRDFPLVQGVVLIGGVMIVALNFVIDVLYAWMDPRIRLPA